MVLEGGFGSKSGKVYIIKGWIYVGVAIALVIGIYATLLGSYFHTFPIVPLVWGIWDISTGYKVLKGNPEKVKSLQDKLKCLTDKSISQKVNETKKPDSMEDDV